MNPDDISLIDEFRRRYPVALSVRVIREVRWWNGQIEQMKVCVWTVLPEGKRVLRSAATDKELLALPDVYV